MSKKIIFIFILATIAQIVALLFLPIKDRDYLKVDVKEHILSNGLKILVIEDPDIPIEVCRINYNVGAINEEKGITGASHFLEHMMFKGTKNFGLKNGMFNEENNLFQVEDVIVELMRKNNNPDRTRLFKDALSKIRKRLNDIKILNDLDNVIKTNGGVGYNAFTNYDQTCYIWSVPKNKLELWFFVESDRMRNLALRDFYTEIEVVLEERRMRVENSPASKVSSRLEELVLGDTPYGRPEWIIGSAEDISGFTRNEIMEYYKNYYSPNNATIVLAGGAGSEEIIRLADKYFGGIPPGDIKPVDVSIFGFSNQNGENRVAIHDPENKIISIGYRTVPMSHPDLNVLSFISEMLAGGKTSLLYESLVKTGLASEAKAYNIGYKYAGIMELSICFNEKKDIQPIESAIYEKMEDFKNGLISEEKIKLLKKRIKADFIKELMSLDSLIGDVVYYEAIAGDWRKLNNFIPEIEKITKEDISRVAKKYINYSNRSVVIMADEESGGEK